MQVFSENQASKVVHKTKPPSTVLPQGGGGHTDTRSSGPDKVSVKTEKTVKETNEAEKTAIGNKKAKVEIKVKSIKRAGRRKKKTDEDDVGASGGFRPGKGEEEDVKDVGSAAIGEAVRENGSEVRVHGEGEGQPPVSEVSASVELMEKAWDEAQCTRANVEESLRLCTAAAEIDLKQGEILFVGDDAVFDFPAKPDKCSPSYGNQSPYESSDQGSCYSEDEDGEELGEGQSISGSGVIADVQEIPRMSVADHYRTVEPKKTLQHEIALKQQDMYDSFLNNPKNMALIKQQVDPWRKPFSDEEVDDSWKPSRVKKVEKTKDGGSKDILYDEVEYEGICYEAWQELSRMMTRSPHKDVMDIGIAIVASRQVAMLLEQGKKEKAEFLSKKHDEDFGVGWRDALPDLSSANACTAVEQVGVTFVLKAEMQDIPILQIAAPLMGWDWEEEGDNMLSDSSWFMKSGHSPFLPLRAYGSASLYGIKPGTHVWVKNRGDGERGFGGADVEGENQDSLAVEVARTRVAEEAAAAAVAAAAGSVAEVSVGADPNSWTFSAEIETVLGKYGMVTGQGLNASTSNQKSALGFECNQKRTVVMGRDNTNVNSGSLLEHREVIVTAQLAQTIPIMGTSYLNEDTAKEKGFPTLPRIYASVLPLVPGPNNGTLLTMNTLLQTLDTKGKSDDPIPLMSAMRTDNAAISGVTGWRVAQTLNGGAGLKNGQSMADFLTRALLLIQQGNNVMVSGHSLIENMVFRPAMEQEKFSVLTIGSRFDDDFHLARVAFPLSVGQTTPDPAGGAGAVIDNGPDTRIPAWVMTMGEYAQVTTGERSLGNGILSSQLGGVGPNQYAIVPVTHEMMSSPNTLAVWTSLFLETVTAVDAEGDYVVAEGTKYLNITRSAPGNTPGDTVFPLGGAPGLQFSSRTLVRGPGKGVVFVLTNRNKAGTQPGQNDNFTIGTGINAKVMDVVLNSPFRTPDGTAGEGAVSLGLPILEQLIGTGTADTQPKKAATMAMVCIEWLASVGAMTDEAWESAKFLASEFSSAGGLKPQRVGDGWVFNYFDSRGTVGSGGTGTISTAAECALMSMDASRVRWGTNTYITQGGVEIDGISEEETEWQWRTLLTPLGLQRTFGPTSGTGPGGAVYGWEAGSNTSQAVIGSMDPFLLCATCAGYVGFSMADKKCNTGWNIGQHQLVKMIAENGNVLAAACDLVVQDSGQGLISLFPTMDSDVDPMSHLKRKCYLSHVKLMNGVVKSVVGAKTTIRLTADAAFETTPFTYFPAMNVGAGRALSSLVQASIDTLNLPVVGHSEYSLKLSADALVFSRVSEAYKRATWQIDPSWQLDDYEYQLPTKTPVNVKFGTYGFRATTAGVYNPASVDRILDVTVKGDAATEYEANAKIISTGKGHWLGTPGVALAKIPNDMTLFFRCGQNINEWWSIAVKLASPFEGISMSTIYRGTFTCDIAEYPYFGRLPSLSISAGSKIYDLHVGVNYGGTNVTRLKGVMPHKELLMLKLKDGNLKDAQTYDLDYKDPVNIGRSFRGKAGDNDGN